MNNLTPASQYAPTADYALTAATTIPYPVLIAGGLVCGAVFLIGMSWLLMDDRRATRDEAISEAQCHHPAGSDLTDWGKVEPLSDGWWICVCPNPDCREIGHLFQGPRGGRLLNLAEARAEYQQWQHRCTV